MKATLFVIENDADHALAKGLIEKLMKSDDPADRARMTAQARLIEAYERGRWPRQAPSLPDLQICPRPAQCCSWWKIVERNSDSASDRAQQSAIQNKRLARKEGRVIGSEEGHGAD